MAEPEYKYEPFAEETYELYGSFRHVGFSWDQAFELVKVCVANSYANPYAAFQKKPVRREPVGGQNAYKFRTECEKEKNNGT